MYRVWVILITSFFLNFVHSKSEECLSPRPWQVGNTIYENKIYSGVTYLYARCSVSGLRISRSWIQCINGQIKHKLPQCGGDDILYWCGEGNRWNASSTEYEVIKQQGTLFVIARCNQLGFASDGEELIPCPQFIRQQSLPHCKNITGENYVCEQGKKWNAKNTDYQIFRLDDGLIVSAKCNTPGFHIGDKKFAYCENGRIPTRLPQCRYGKEYCSDLSKPENGHIFCSTNAPAKNSSCNFLCEDTHYLRGSRKRICEENLRWSGKPVQCHIRRDPCTISNCSHYCRNKDGAAQCYCQVGYMLADDQKTCTGVTQLFVTENPQLRVETNTWRADRNPGDVRETQPSDINTCYYNNGDCNHFCKDENGTIYCSCRKGFELQKEDNKTCEDINECLLENFGCSDKCINTQGGAYCSCLKGFKLKRDGKHCTDINECESRTLNNCNHKCNNNNGSYTCSCHKGYVPINDFKCKDVNECLIDNFGCSDRCVNTPGNAYCVCSSGFRLKSDGKHCTDIDECANKNSNNCSQMCHNTDGGYTCSCNPGFVFINDFQCEGCRINSYRSNSDTACVECPSNSHTNSDGKTSLEDCLCNSGFYGNISNDEPCRDFNECDSGNFGCSYNCVNTLGSAFCSCPQGFQLQEDQKTCSDIDECSVKNGGCQGICHNLIGSFNCTCQEGYIVSEADNYACDDVDECKENNGGCSGECINFLGGYQCSCAGDSRLGVDGKTCQTLFCSEVPVPYHSRLICFPESNRTAKAEYLSRETSHSAKLPVGTLCKVKCEKGYTIEEYSRTISCQRNGKWNNTIHECKVSQCPPLKAPDNGDVHPPECKEGSRTVKEKCYFTCNEGYRMKDNKTVFICKNRLTWNYHHSPNCEPELITPYVTCPNDLTVDLLPDQNSSNVILKYPESNMEDIRVSPDWVDFGIQIAFPAGKTEINVVARSLNFNNLTASCSLSVIVLDKEFPEFIECPEAIHVNGSNGVVVYWTEPLAVDNVGIKSIIKNAEPNSTWFPGVHTVEYVAEDFGGNTVRCSFEINITSPECGDLEDPENGEANCQDWVYGKLCEPSCNLNYTRGDNDSQYYVCDDNGMWSPSSVISPCIPECEYEEIWSQELERCVYIDMDATDANYV